MIGGYVGAIIIAAVAAGIELGTRYQDDAARLRRSVPFWFYVAVNAAIALGAAFWLVSFYPSTIMRPDGSSGTSVSDALLAVYAGFGSLAVLRAGIMKVRVGGGNEVSVGPGLLLEGLLFVVDRAVDRTMASYRGSIADELVPQLTFETHGIKLVTECLGRLTNVSAEEGQRLNEVVRGLTGRNDIDARQKSRLLLMTLLATAGETVLKQSVKSVTT